jgi:hypothetical protein
LAQACGDKITVQLPWWPGVDYVFTYELLKGEGEVDPETNAFAGTIPGTGVELEIRPGGPAVGFQPEASVLYQDDSIDFVIRSSSETVATYEDLPTTSVFSYYDVFPTVLIWGEEEWDFQTLEDVKQSDATVLVYSTSTYLTVLDYEGKLNDSKVDRSYDGSPARFVSENGRIIQQGYITTEPYQLEHEVAQWGKPVRFLSLNADFPAYGTTLAVRTGELEERAACLSEFVPLVQQAAVDYALDPTATNQLLVDYTNQLPGISVVLTPDLLAASNAAQLKYGLVANGTDGVFGSFDLERTQALTDRIAAALRATGTAVPDQIDASAIVTNEFLDPDIKLPADAPVPANTLPDASEVGGLKYVAE